MLAAPAPAEFEFTLPEGIPGPDGTRIREGAMRMATAYDELAPLKDPRVQRNPGYLVVILLSRVITRLGGLDRIDAKLIESLFAIDLAYLQDLYQRINRTGSHRLRVACPHCEGEFDVEPPAAGGS
ncbi:MAG: phage tail assembly protein [Myxococcales bacterium]|nr:phage tail assembly protein [Myxococcales bacterium]